MSNIRRIAASIVLAAAIPTGMSTATTPLAAAATHVSTIPKPMRIAASGGDGTTVDHDGTQGSFTAAVQGKIDDDDDQDAFRTKSEEAKPQEKSPPARSKSQPEKVPPMGFEPTLPP